MILFILKSSKRIQIINKEKKENFPNSKKINQFTNEYFDFLQKVFKKYNWEIDEDLIENLIDEALTLKTHNYNVAFAEQLKYLFEQLGTVKLVTDFYIELGQKLDIHLIKKYIKRLLNEEKYQKRFKDSEYNPLEISGDSFYERWDKNNSRIIIDKKIRKVLIFNSKLRIKITLEIYKFLKNYNEPIYNDLIINHLKELIEKSPYFGRLNYLIKNNEYSLIIIDYLKRLITLVKEIIKNPSETAFSIAKKLGLKRDTVQSIINEIKKNE